MHSRDLRNGLLNLTGEALWGFQMALIAAATVLAVLLKGLGAPVAMIGCISAIEGGLIVLPQILGIYVFHSRRRRKRQLMLFHFACMLPFLLVMSGLASPALSLSPQERCWALLGGFACFTFAMGVVTAAWMDWVAHVFDIRIRGTAMGLSWSAAALCGSVGALVAGAALSAAPVLATYSKLYLAAAAVAYVSITVFCFIDDRPDLHPASPAPFSLPVLIDRFRQSLADPNFRAFLVGRMLATAGFCILPLVTIYYTSQAGGAMSPGAVVSCGAAQTVGMGLSGYLLGRLGDRRGHRAGVLIGAAMQVLVLSVMIFTTGLVSCLAAFFGVGVCVGVNLVSHFNLLFETCRHDNRMAHITVGNLVISVATIGGPVLASVAATVWPLRSIFAACLVFSAAALLWLWRRVKDPRDEPPLILDTN